MDLIMHFQLTGEQVEATMSCGNLALLFIFCFSFTTIVLTQFIGINTSYFETIEFAPYPYIITLI